MCAMLCSCARDESILLGQSTGIRRVCVSAFAPTTSARVRACVLVSFAFMLVVLLAELANTANSGRQNHSDRPGSASSSLSFGRQLFCVHARASLSLRKLLK